MRAGSGIAVLSAGLLLALPAQAHIQLNSPTARYVQNDNGLTTAPCGSGTATGTVTKVVPGQMLTVTWKESISHAGHYRIGLSAKQSDFTDPTSLAVPNPLPPWDLADGIPDKTGTQTYSQSVQIPDQECPACVLQLIQVASGGTDGTNTGSVFAIYHACADLAITAANGDGGAAHDSAAPDAHLDLGSVGGDAVRRDAMPVAGDGAGDSLAADTAGALGTGGSTATGGAGGAGGTSGRAGSGGAAGSGAGGSMPATSAGQGGGAGGAGGASVPATTAEGGHGSGGNAPSGGSSAANGGGGGASSAAQGGTTVSAAGGSGGGGAGGDSRVTTPGSNGCSCDMGRPEPRPAWALIALLTLGFALGLGKRRGSRP